MPDTSEKSKTLMDRILAWPLVDMVIPFSTITVWWLLGAWTPEDLIAIDSFYTGITATAGIILAASTFVASQIYFSPGSYMTMLREEYSEDLLRNWTHILISLLVATLLPLLSVLSHATFPQFSFGLAIFAVALAATRSLRVVWWFRITHKLMELSQREPERFVPKFRNVD